MKDNSYCEVIKYLSCFVCALSEAKGMIKFMRIGIDIGHDSQDWTCGGGNLSHYRQKGDTN